jgi:hypothetical protein
VVVRGARSVEDTLPDPGAELGGYRLVARLGAGGMGQVYAAHPPGGGELVALKQIGVFDPAHLYRFKQEFRVLADLAHPNLVKLGELVVLHSGVAFFTMERIEGQTFLRWVRRRLPAGMPPNLHRLVYAMRQLALGVQYLHRSGRVHRDLKPSNVMVSHEGRVVVLDFGLVFSLDADDARITMTGQLVGTPAYLAPEHATRREVSPAVDLYALGVMLFECLTGVLPFATTSRLALELQRERAPDPRELVPDVPAPLAMLCRGLLEVDPQQRTSIDELLVRLDELAEREGAPTSEAPRELELLGREHELAQLEAMFADLGEQGGAGLVRMSGPQGRGKTALVERFLQSVAERDDALVLRGRCHPRESVPFAGIDAVVDALARYLRSLPELELAKLQPRRVTELAELFPVLDKLWRSTTAWGSRQDPLSRRRHAVASLRELLLRLSDQAPLVVCIDDFQWSDGDGLDVLAELLLPPESPAMLVVLAFDAASGGPIVERVREVELFRGPRILDLELEPLAHADALALARALLGAGDDARVRALVESAGGEPLALIEATRSSSREPVPERSDAELMRAIQSLDASAQTLLELSVLLGEPLSAEHAALLLEGGRSAVERAHARLVAAELHSAVAADRPHEFELAARIIALVRVELDVERARGLHGRLARMLQQIEAEPERVADHFERAGEPEHARASLRAAAHAAAEALAFVRAERLYRRALVLCEDAAERGEVQLALAEQLVHLARCPQAAELFVALAATRPGQEAARLRLRAAEQYAISGWYRQSLELLRDLLTAAGERLPSSPAGALAMFAWNAATLWGYRRWRRWWPGKPGAATLERFHLVYVACMAISRRDIVMCMPLIPLMLKLALESGESSARIMALSIDVGIQTTLGRQSRASALADEALRIADDLDDPYYLAYAKSCVYLGRPIMTIEDADAMFQEIESCLDRCRGESWLRGPMSHRHALMLQRAGGYRRMLSQTPAWLAAMRTTGQRQFEVLMICDEAIARAQIGRFEFVQGALAHARTVWELNEYNYVVPIIANAETWLALAQAQYEQAETLARANEAEFMRRGFGRVKVPRMRMRATTLYATLAAAIWRGRLDDAPTSRELGRLRRCGLANHAVEALVLMAGRASLAGERACELELWRRARDECRQVGALGLAAAAAWRLAELDVPDRADLEAEARAYFEAEGIGAVEHFVRMLAPALRSDAQGRGSTRVP